MQVNTVFDRLVVELSREERRKFLEKIEKLVPISDEPLSDEVDERQEIDFAALFVKLGFFQKIFILLRALFTGRPREDLIEEKALNDLGREIQRECPGMMDFSKRIFLPAFVKEIKELQASIVIFSPVLGKILGKNKPDFIAFLAGTEMEETQIRLLLETDPYYQVAKYVNKGEVLVHEKDLPNIEIPSVDDLSDAEVKRLMENALDDIFQFLPADGRSVMYQNMKFLRYLDSIAAFPFDRLIQAFYPVSELQAVPCPFERVKDTVLRLAEILSSMSLAPSPRFLRTMFLFVDGEKTENNAYNLEEDFSGQIKAADEALKKIRGFNKIMAMPLIARYLSGNINYRFPVSGGGEDWFVLLKQFWKGRIDLSNKQFSIKRKQDDLLREIIDSLGGVPLLFIDGYLAGGGEGKSRGTYSLSLGFMKTFFSHHFPKKFNRHLKTLLIDGEFYKDDNRTEFTDAYNGLLNVSVLLDRFETRLAERGDFGIALRQTEQEMVSKIVRQQKMKNLAKSIDQEARSLLQGGQDNFQTLINVLNGILHGEVGGRYDTLSNIGYIGGRGNQAYLKNLEEVLGEAKKVSTLLEKLYVLENSTA